MNGREIGLAIANIICYWEITPYFYKMPKKKKKKHAKKKKLD